MSSTPLPPELSQALDAIRPWLQDLGYSLSLDPDTSSFTDGQLGEYKLGSVFEKDIVIRVSPRNIRKAIHEYPEAFEIFPKEVRFTVFHEVGHALLEQLIDYANNIEDYLLNIEAKYGDKFLMSSTTRTSRKRNWWRILRGRLEPTPNPFCRNVRKHVFAMIDYS